MSSAELAHTLAGGERVLFGTRADGNMSSVSGSGADAGSAARERLRGRLGLRRIVRGRQVHGAVVARVADPIAARPDTRELAEADGQATAMRDVGVMVLTADCLPVALGCGDAVAMLHAGWRGLAAGVLEEGVRALRQLGGGGEMAAVIGPGAGACCYEVGADVHAAIAAGARAGPIDLSAIARERLQRMGVAHVCELRVCTICDTRFFSHRREGARAGRQAAVAWLS